MKTHTLHSVGILLEGACRFERLFRELVKHVHQLNELEVNTHIFVECLNV